MSVRTRFAPSPTGFLHIGGARTALFCHLHTRHVGGKFLLRIEDTDRERSSKEAVDVILQGMHWLGLDSDEDPVFQSDHTSQHLIAAQRLLDENKAYRCYCSKETLDAMRDQQRQQNIKPRYDGRCREQKDFPARDQPHVIRFKTPTEGNVTWDDLIQGKSHFPNNEMDDLILVRSDGSPTYNLAVVVDDHDMDINLVIRGQDHMSNTPRQIHLFQALGWSVPSYAHMPLLHGSDGGKLSKRHGAVSVLQYRDEGFLASAVNNYLVRLGWSHGEQEIFSRTQMEQAFEINNVGRSAAIFDQSKLLWINGHHIREADVEQLLPDLLFQLKKIGLSDPDLSLVRAVIPEFQPRSKTMVEMAEKCQFFFVDSVLPYQAKAAKKHFYSADIQPFSDLIDTLKKVPEWTVKTLENALQSVLENHSLKLGILAQPVRVALTGSSTSPGIYETLFLLGRDKSLERLETGLRLLKEKSIP